MLTANQLAHVLDRPAAAVLVDVREPKEIELGRIPGALSIPLGDLSERAGELAPDDEIVVYCQSGVRSERAVRQLRQLGFSHVSHLDEGFQSWLAARQPMSHR